VIDVEETFAGPLEAGLWLPYYLPQWSSRERSAARYVLADGALRLRIEADQAPWCPELDGELRVSSLQTGVFAGPLGSAVGQHRFHPRAVVREEQRPQRLCTPLHGRVEVRAKALDDPYAMAAFWLIGYEDEPDRCGEICVCEIFGRDVRPDRAAVGMGVRAFADPRLRDDFAAVELPIDVREAHVYAADWRPGRVDFLVDGELVRTVGQAPDYPMQLMLGIYELPGGERPPTAYPKELVVERVVVRSPDAVHA
jgi:Glycosyl hydrolases family 16